MPDKPGNRVLGIGSALLDTIVRAAPEWIAENVSGKLGGSDLLPADKLNDLIVRAERAFSVRHVAGGSSANTLAGLSLLGVPSLLAGRIGRDAAGKIYRDSFAASGGDVSALRYDDTLPTGRCLCLVTPDSERTLRTCLGASGALSGADIAEKDFAGVSFVLFEGYLLYTPSAAQKTFELANAAGVPVGIDLASFELVGKFREQLTEYVRRSEVVFANVEEARALADAPAANEEELLAFLAGLAPVAALKLGRKGAWLRRGDEVFRIPPDLVEHPVDTTGAGDLWQTGFLYGYLKNCPLELCGRFASAAASECVRVQGARLPDAVWHRLQKQFQLWE